MMMRTSSRKRERQTSPLSVSKLSIALSLSTVIFLSFDRVESAAFPARIPDPPSRRPTFDTSAGYSDDDTEVESSSDFEDSLWLPLNESASPKPVQIDQAKNENSQIPEPQDTSDNNNSNQNISQPMQTLQKLQQMLDETDYRTTVDSTRKPVSPSNDTKPPPSPPSTNTPDSSQSADKLWTSQDRAKYRVQQRKQARVTTPIHMASSDDDVSDEDGLGYSLPNLPVYHSDAESDADVDSSTETKPPPQSQMTPPPMPPRPVTQTQPGYYGQYMPQQPNPYSVPPQGYPVMPYQSYAPYPYYDPRMMYRPQYGPYSSLPPVPSYGQRPPAPPQPAQVKQEQSAKVEVIQQQPLPPPQPASQAMIYVDPQLRFESSPREITPAESLAEASSLVNFSSIQKIGIMMVAAAVACYSGVSPRDLPLEEYNLRFYKNCKLVALSLIGPIVNMVSVFDARENDINSVINSFFVSFTFGYALIFLSEIVLTTAIRLGVFSWFEPGIFSLTPKVPVPILPWVLREMHYRPKRITLFVADLLVSCVASPIVEEYAKYKLLDWTTKLPKNFNWVYKESTKGNKKSIRRVAEPIVRTPPETDVVNANKIITQALAVSIGIKMADVGRRILLYTKPAHEDQGFYAICRGLFPIQELCGTMTALGVAKRNLLGVSTPSWVILLPAIVVHGMANFRGMKPIFKWNSATPWSEMQLSPLSQSTSETLPQLLSKAFPKFMWLVILSRVLGYCIKNYYMINRQAVKRTTTYAGKHSAFTAELVTAAALKKQEKKHNRNGKR